MLGLHLIDNADGFTLNEVLVSIALIAISVLGLSLNTIGVIQGNHISGNITVATNLAQDKVEELKALTTLTNVDHCSSYSGDRGITATGAAGGIFNRCWRIGDSPLGPGLKQIDVTIAWRDYLPRSVTLSTLVFAE
jgi:prepilin-type N-terminal cleavage/methylation domain-containing protein